VPILLRGEGRRREGRGGNRREEERRRGEGRGGDPLLSRYIPAITF